MPSSSLLLESCTCDNGELINIPNLPIINEHELPPVTEQQHLLCAALPTLFCKRTRDAKPDKNCINLPKR